MATQRRRPRSQRTPRVREESAFDRFVAPVFGMLVVSLSSLWLADLFPHALLTAVLGVAALSVVFLLGATLLDWYRRRVAAPVETAGESGSRRV